MSHIAAEQLDSLELEEPTALPPAGGGLDLYLLGISLLRRLPWVLVLTILGTAAGFFASQRVQEKYQARTVMLNHNKNTASNPDIYIDPSLRTILETVKVRGNLDELKRRLNLKLSTEDLFDAIEVKQGNRNDIIQIQATAHSPKLAADIANQISRIFQNSSAGISRSVAERVYRFRQSQHNALMGELKLAQNRLDQFQRKHQVSFFEDTTRLILEQIKQLDLDQNNAQIQLQKDHLRMGSLSKQLANRPENIRVTTTVRHRTKVYYDQLQNELKGLLERYTEANPKVIALRAQLQTLEKQLANQGPLEPEEESYGMDPVVRELRIQQAQLGSSLSGTERQIKSLSEASKTYQQRLGKLSLLEKDFDNLKRDIDRLSENLRENDAHLAEAFHSMRSNISSFDIVEPASLPQAPLPTRRKLLLLAGLALGFILGLIGALGLELLDFRIKSPRQLTGLGLAYLGLLPQRNRKSHKLYYQNWLLFINRLLLRLQAQSGQSEQGPQILLIAGERAGQGCSFVCEQLLDTLRFRGGQLVHIRPANTSDSGHQDLTAWLQSKDVFLPLPLRIDSQTQLYTTSLDEKSRQRPLLLDKLPEILQRHQEANYILWELPAFEDHLPWLLMLAPIGSALLVITRFRSVMMQKLKQELSELKALTPDLPLYGLLNQVPWAYRGLKGR
jgi:uncharacterized protein involved in exopolysaccharide biosynthesis